jgi:ribosomal protein L23
MAYRYKLREEETETTPSNREQVNYDIVVTPNSVSVEDTVKALETLDNYGMYVSNMRNKSSIQKAIEDHFGPIIPAKRKKM